MTNEQEVLELAKKHGAKISYACSHPETCPDDDSCDGTRECLVPYDIRYMKVTGLYAFSQAIRDQEAAKRARLVEAAKEIIRHDDYAGQYGHLPEAQETIEQSYCEAMKELQSALSASAPEAEAFIREKQAEAVKDAMELLLNHGEDHDWRILAENMGNGAWAELRKGKE